MRIFVSALCLLALISPLTALYTTTLDSGLGVMVSQDTVESFKVLIPGILEKIEGATLPDIPPIDGLEVTDLKITSFEMTVDDLNYWSPSDNVAELDIKNLNLGLSLNFDYKPLHLTGSADITSDDTSMTTMVTVGAKDKKLTLDVTKIELDIGDLVVKISGSFIDKILNLLTSLFKKIVQDVVNKEINDLLKAKAAAIVDKTLSSIPAYVPLGVVPLAFSTAITSGPLLNDTIIAFGLESRLVPTADFHLPEDVPPAKPMPVWMNDGEQTQLYVNEYAVNSALASLSYLNTNFTITGEMLPKTLPISLDATNFEVLFPGISEKYGADTPVDIQIILDDHPDRVLFSTSGMDLDLGVELRFLVKQSENSEPISVVALRLDIGGTVTIDIDDDLIKITVPKLTATYTKLLSSTLDPAPSNESLLTNFEALMQLGQELISVMLPNSVPMPTPNGISLHGTKVTTQSGYLLLETTPNFEPNLFGSAQKSIAEFWHDLLHGSVEAALQVLMKNSFGF